MSAAVVERHTPPRTMLVLGGECRSTSAALLIVCEHRSIHDDILSSFSPQGEIALPLLRTYLSTRGNPYKVLLTVSRANVRRHFFTERTALMWNSLPPSVVNFGSLSFFKKTIYNASLFTRY